MIGHIHSWGLSSESLCSWPTCSIQCFSAQPPIKQPWKSLFPSKAPVPSGLRSGTLTNGKTHGKGQINPSSNSRFQQSKQFLWPVTSGRLGISTDKVPAPKPVAEIICSGHFTALAKRELQEHFTREWINTRSPDTALQFIMLMDHSSSFIFAQKDPKKPSEASAGGHMMHLTKWTVLNHTHFTWRAEILTGTAQLMGRGWDLVYRFAATWAAADEGRERLYWIFPLISPPTCSQFRQLAIKKRIRRLVMYRKTMLW